MPVLYTILLLTRDKTRQETRDKRQDKTRDKRDKTREDKTRDKRQDDIAGPPFMSVCVSAWHLFWLR